MTDRATLQHYWRRQGSRLDIMDVQARTEWSQSWQVPYKQYDGWHSRCPEMVQPTKCSMAGEIGAEVAALDMAAKISSVAARH